MTKQEIKNLINLAAGSFPNFQKSDLVQIGITWEETLGRHSYQLAREALKRVLNRSKYFPSVGDIQEAIATIKDEQRSSVQPKKKTDCPNCGGDGWIMIVQDGEERYGRCPCKAGEKYCGWPTAPAWALQGKPGLKLIQGGQEVQGKLF